MIISVISLLVGLLIGLVVMDIGYNQKINSMKTYIIEQKKIINKKDKSLVETIYILQSIKRFIKNEKGFIKNLKPVPVSKCGGAVLCQLLFAVSAAAAGDVLF